jgi:hypothetical protein
MNVRGWLMIGPASVAETLPPAAGGPMFMGGVPQASDYRPGHWIVWAPAPGQPAVTLVCVEVPL